MCIYIYIYIYIRRASDEAGEGRASERGEGGRSVVHDIMSYYGKPDYMNILYYVMLYCM